MRLRPPTENDAELLRRLASSEVAGAFNFFDDPEDEQLRAADVGGLTLVVELDDGTAVGDVSFFAVAWGPNLRSMAWRIGCTILPEHRRRGYGAQAQSLLAEHLLATTDSNRIEADTDVGNVAERGALERAGFQFEGIVRGAQYRDGQWHDRALYARLRSDRSTTR